MFDVTLAPVLFILFYLVPGAVLISNSAGRGSRLENLALAVLLSLIFAPLTFTLLSSVFPRNDTLLLAAFLTFWALFAAAVRLFPETVRARLPDFGAIPRADKVAWLVSILLAAIVVSLRLGVLQGNASQVGDDNFHLIKLTSIAATGLPSLHARQPLYPFVYYDLDYIAPALWVRYTSGAVGIAMAWVVHIGVHTLVASLFLTRLIYIFAPSRLTRLFGLLALHTATGFDVLFLPRLLKMHHETGSDAFLHLEAWTKAVGLFDGFMRLLMPINFYVWIPQHLLGLAILGLVFLLITASRRQGFFQTIALAFLMAALFRTSVFVFLGALPGLALWYIHRLWTGQDRLRQLLHLATAALIALALVFPSIADFSAKRSCLEFGLRSFASLDIPGLPWLKYPVTALTYLFLEMGIPFVILLWVLLRPSLRTAPVRFWVFTASALLIPFVMRLPDTNDIAMRGVMPAQLSLAVIGCYALTRLEAHRRSLAAAVVIAQAVLSLSTVGAELYLRFTEERPPVPSTTQWIASHTPLDSLVFYEGNTKTEYEVNYGFRMSYNVWHASYVDRQHMPFHPSAWHCLPEVDLHSEGSICATEALIPGAQPVYVKYASPEPQLDSSAFSLVHQTEDASIFSLACPVHSPPQFSEPPMWTVGPYPQYRTLLQEIPTDHMIAATTHSLVDWLKSEGVDTEIIELAPEPFTDATARQTHFTQRLRAIDELSSPLWLFLDHTQDHPWNEQLLTHALENFFVAQPTASAAQWLECRQRFLLALPATDDQLRPVHDSIDFGGKLAVSEWRVGSRSYQPGEIIPMELAWRSLEEGNFKIFVHLLDLDWNLFAQIDLSADIDATIDSQRTRMGLYLPPDLPAGEYQIRLGIYRAEDGQRLTLPSGEDSVHIPFGVTQ